MLEIQNLNVRYGKHLVLKDISLRMSPGIYALLGENGAGKTTLIRVLTTLRRPNSGSVLYQDRNISKEEKWYRNQIGYMPQYASYYPDFSVEEFMRYMGGIKGVSRREIKARVDELLRYVNLLDQGKKKIGKLSGGMRQRLGIAQAMLNRPSVLILDEPTAGLDPKERIRFRNMLTELSGDKIVLIATHIVQDVDLMAKEIILLHEGEVRIQGRPEELEDSIAGRVFSLRVRKEELSKIQKKYLISNVRYEAGDAVIRLVLREGQDAPMAGERIRPDMEEVFLHYTGGEACDVAI